MCQPLLCTPKTQLTISINMYIHKHGRFYKEQIYHSFNVEDASAIENVMDIHISSSR